MLTRTRQRKNNRIGFTLMEVLLVMAILVILGSVVVMNFSKVFDDAKLDNAKIQLQALKIPLGMFKLHTGNFPSSDAGLDALRTAPGDVDDQRWRGPYLPTELEPDPWGNEYDYVLTSEGYRIWSKGPDGADDGKDDISVTSYDAK